MTTVDPIFILNEKNVLITEDHINHILDKYGIEYKINNIELFIEAMTHKTYCIRSYEDKKNGFHKVKEISNTKAPINKKIIPLQEKTYERLEFLGDAVMHTISSEYLYDRYDKQQEGDMTILRAKLEKSDTYAELAAKLRLDKYVLLSRFLEETNSRYNDTHIWEDVFEAFIGALFLDIKSNKKISYLRYELCANLLIKLIEVEVDISELLLHGINFKDILLQYAHNQRWPDPVYGIRGVYGNETKNYIYEAFVQIKGNIEGVGKGNSKSKGEQSAAHMALKKFHVDLNKFHVVCDDSDSSDDEFVPE